MELASANMAYLHLHVLLHDSLQYHSLYNKWLEEVPSYRVITTFFLSFSLGKNLQVPGRVSTNSLLKGCVSSHLANIAFITLSVYVGILTASSLLSSSDVLKCIYRSRKIIGGRRMLDAWKLR
jgi:hypothetical protein